DRIGIAQLFQSIGIKNFSQQVGWSNGSYPDVLSEYWQYRIGSLDNAAYAGLVEIAPHDTRECDFWRPENDHSGLPVCALRKKYRRSAVSSKRHCFKQV